MTSTEINLIFDKLASVLGMQKDSIMELIPALWLYGFMAPVGIVLFLALIGALLKYGSCKAVSKEAREGLRFSAGCFYWLSIIIGTLTVMGFVSDLIFLAVNPSAFKVYYILDVLGSH